MRTLLRPYEGTQPYIFVSYAHKNDAAVLEIIGTLQSRGFRVWYDEGIEAGSEWPESIASHLERAQLVLAFLSPAYLQSDNCRKEMHYALTKKKPVINVYLEQTAAAQALAGHFGLVPTGGSDYHGLRKPDIALGSGRGGLRVPYAWLAGLKALAGPGRV